MVGIPINVRSVLGAAETAINHPPWFVVCLHGTEKGRQGGKSWTENPRNRERLTRHKTCGRERLPTEPSICTGDRRTYSTSCAGHLTDRQSQPGWLSIKDNSGNNAPDLTKNPNYVWLAAIFIDILKTGLYRITNSFKIITSLKCKDVTCS